MVTTLTIGGIWKNKKTNKEYELVAVNKETNKVQIASTTNGEGYNCMTENSLRKNYTLVSIKKEKTQTPQPILMEETNDENRTWDALGEEIAAEPTKQPQASRQPGRVELQDGRVIPGIRFLLDIAKKTEAETCKNSSVIYWLQNAKAGKELLAQFDAKVVYKPLTK